MWWKQKDRTISNNEQINWQFQPPHIYVINTSSQDWADITSNQISLDKASQCWNFRFCTQLLSGILKSRKKIPLHVNLSSRRQFHSFIQSCISIWMHLLQLCNAPEFTDSFKMKDLPHFQREYFYRDQIKTLFNITPGLLLQRCLHQSAAYSLHL